MIEETVFVVASGPSLTREDCETLRTRGAAVLSVSDSYLWLPFAEWHYACDLFWYMKPQPGDTEPRGKRVREIIPACFTSSTSAVRHFGLLRAPMFQGSNSGTHAIQLAARLEARHIGLLGFDFAHGPNGERHFFGDHVSGLRNAPGCQTWLRELPPVIEKLNDAGVSVVNYSRRTAIPKSVVPRATL